MVKIIVFSFRFLFVLFLVFVLNIGFPPFLGFLGEVYILKIFSGMRFVFYIFVLGVLLSCYYNMYIYWCFSRSFGKKFFVSFAQIDLFIFLFFVLWFGVY